MEIEEGVYTHDDSFRAKAEAKARQYRESVLKLSEYDKWGHILIEQDGADGMNFLPSLRQEILNDVHKRNAKGKGVDIPRTTKNMLSSQAMCFNLFAPLNLNKELATAFFNHLLGDVYEISGKVEYEYTPDKSIFNDQSGKGGVDCDALVTYKNKDGKTALLVIETKYVETEFSRCGYRKVIKKDEPSYNCPMDTIVHKDFSNCRYHDKKHFKYWTVAAESGLYKMDMIHDMLCPFGGHLWQLWTNMSLAYALAKEKGIDVFHYAVICPENNTKLTNHGKTFDEFRQVLIDPVKLKVIYLDDVKMALLKAESEFSGNIWMREFVDRYC